MKVSSTISFIFGSAATIGIAVLLKKKGVDIIDEAGKAVSSLVTIVKDKLDKSKSDTVDD